jgi:hypothetical protein
MEKNKKETKPIKINEGREKGNTRNVTTPRPNTTPAPQSLTQKVDF